MKETPKVILDNVKNSLNLEVIIRFDALYLALKENGILKGNYHNLGKDLMKNLPKYINNPDVIIKLDNGRLNSIKILPLENKNNGIISIELNTVKDINSKYQKYNLVVSVFKSNNNYLKNIISKANEVVYKKEDLPQVNEQLYEWLTIVNDKSSINNISQNNENVNIKQEDLLKNNKNTRFALKDKKITADMTDEERYEILKERELSLSATVDYSKLDSIKEKFDIQDNSFEIGNTSYKKKLLKKIAEEFDIFKTYNNSDIELDFIYSKKNLGESVNKQKESYLNFAKMLTCFDNVIKNAIGIEVHNRNNEGYKPDPQLENMYILTSIFIDGDNLIPVKLEIKEFNDKKNTLYVAIALESIKKDEITPKGNTTSGVTEQFGPSSIISITDLLKKINPKDENFIKYIPNQILSKEQIKAKELALKKDEEKLEKLKENIKFSNKENSADNKDDSLPSDFNEKLDIAVSDDVKSDDKRYLNFGYIPKEFTEKLKGKIDIKNLPLLMNYRDVYLAVNSKENGKFIGDNIHYHNLGKETLKQLKTKLKNPLYVIKSDKIGRLGQERIQVIIDLKDYNDNNILVLIELNTHADKINDGKEYINSHIVNSAYGKRSVENLIKKSNINDKILYPKDIKKDTLASDRIGPMPSYNEQGVTYSIKEKREIVNKNLNKDPEFSRKEDLNDYNYSEGQSIQNENPYSYENLIKKEDLHIVNLSEKIPLTNEGKINRTAVINYGKENAKSKNNKLNTDYECFVYVKDIDKNVRVNNDGLKHGLGRNVENTVIATMKIGDLLENSIAVNELSGRTTTKKTTDMSYVLLAKGRTSNDEFIVRMVVDKNSNAITEISSYSLYAIKSIKNGDYFMPNGNEDLPKGSNPYLISTISIKDFLNNVKNLNLANEVFSKDVVEKLQVNRHQDTLSKGLRFSQKENNYNYSEGQIKKYIANHSRMKVYSKEDAEISINNILDSTFNFENIDVKISNKTINQVVKELWSALNTEDEGFRVKTALKIADYLIENSSYQSVYHDSELEYPRFIVEELKGYLHSLNLQPILEEIKSHFGKDKSVTALWSERKNSGKKGLSIEQVARELQEKGILIFEDTINEADLFIEMHEAYKEALDKIKKEAEPLNKFLNESELYNLKQEISREILKAYDTQGKESMFAKLIKKYTDKIKVLQEKVKTQNQKMRLYNNIVFQAQKIGEEKLEIFSNATEHKMELFKSTIGKLSKISSKNNFNESGTRDILKGLSQWYTKNNPLLVEDSGDYNQGVADTINSIVTGEGDLSIEELKDLESVLKYFRHFIENYNKVLHNGKYVDALPLAENYIKIIEKIAKIKRRHKRFVNWFENTFLDPNALVRKEECYQNGFFTQTMEELRDALIKVDIAKMKILEEYNNFLEDKDNKNYLKDLYDTKIKINGIEISKIQAISLYMTQNRQQAWKGLGLNGFAFQDLITKDFIEINGANENAKNQDEIMYSVLLSHKALEEQFSEKDLKFVKILEDIFNKQAKELKKQRDMEKYGFSNILDSYYFPIRRDAISKNIDTSIMGELDRISNASFNKDTVQGAAQKLFIEPIDVVLNRHIRHIFVAGYR